MRGELPTSVRIVFLISLDSEDEQLESYFNYQGREEVVVSLKLVLWSGGETLAITLEEVQT